MAIAYDTTAQNSGTGSSSTLSWSHTVTGSSPILLVSIAADGGAGSATVTYNGVSMTSIYTDPTAGVGIQTFYLINPAVGSNTVTISYGSAKTNRNGISVSYTGVNQSSFPDSASYINYPGGMGTTQSVSLTSLANNCWAVGIAWNNSGATITAGANTTMRSPQTNTPSGRNGAVGDSNGAITPAGGYTLNYANSGSSSWAVHAFTIAPVAPKNGNFLMVL